MGHSQIARHTVPESKAAYLLSIHIGVDTAKNPADVFLFKRNDAHIVTAPFSPKRLQVEFDGLTGRSDLSPKSPMRLGAKTDIWFSGISVGGGGAAPRVSVDFELAEVEE